MTKIAAFLAVLAIAACAPAASDFDPPSMASTSAQDEKSVTKPSMSETTKPIPMGGVEGAVRGPLPAFFDCVRENDGMLIASHRGGPAPGYPENALETLMHARANATIIHEIDVAESRDGVLFLLHDRTLGRTTTGDGMVADTDWETIAQLNLVDNDGQITRFNPPKLSDVLLWAKQSGAIVELDRKPTTSFRNIISHVRAAGAEDHVVLITYNDQQAIEVARLAPDLMMTAGIDSREHQAELEAAGVDMTKVIAWMGTRNPNPRAFRAVGARGIETAFGTLGRPGNRLDDEYLADGDPSEFEELYEGGLTLLATDAVYEVSRALLADDKAMAACASR
ncbi:MAG: glycerophosphodiester phosphodiesterase family protein [Pseudomonadota bacterium]